LAARQCPNCLQKVPASKIGSHSNRLSCAGCGKHLEISGFSRNIAAFIGLAVGALVWRVSTTHFAGSPNALGWVLPILFAYLSLSAVQALVLIAVADLRIKELIEPPVSGEAHTGSGGHGHGPAGHASH
jgi:hypothetical protein